MKDEKRPPLRFRSIAELNRALGLPEPQHPLVSLNDYSQIRMDLADWSRGVLMNAYKISYKKNFTGKFRYGREYYDFDSGGLCFISPNQVVGAHEGEEDYQGFSLIIHPDFIRNYPLGKAIKNYGFFSYTASEALHLSEKESETLMGVFKAIGDELALPIDGFSQDVMVAQIELLLTYSNRYYNRQFITRKAVNNELLAKLDDLLADYFNSGKAANGGLPTVQYVSDKLGVSPRYLSDMLRLLTGQNTQQHIHHKLIEIAKDTLGGSTLSIAEVAYRLGFEHPQSFNKIFKQKTQLSPQAYRQSLN